MRSWPVRPRKSPRIEIIPMIDVMMFLLVFFVLISLNSLPSRGLKVALPYAADPTHLDVPKRVTLTLAANGDTYLDGVKMSLADLGNQLQQLAQQSKLTVIIAGDQGVRLQPLVSVLDTLKRAGIGSASIIAKPE
ncbi:MAG TPA: biopolymer transporter ExbD [Steroidobacteraceae bacterium]|jgi:biopolymer transport protein ExbD